MTLNIVPIPAYQDNYIWIIHDNMNAVVVDPGLAGPVDKYLAKHQLNLSHILITHHHWDHVNGLESLQDKWGCTVFAPFDSRIPGHLVEVTEGQLIELAELGLTLQVMKTPGHTLSHICYFNEQLLFCGDTLFSMGCGRMFEGDATQYTDSMNKIKSLSPETWVYCTHEYTLSNIEFALSIDPDNQAIKAKKQAVQSLREKNLPSLPVKLCAELALNPFLRTDQNELQALMSSKTSQLINDEVTCFAILRSCKDQF